mmetsp:Transcript_16313/g.42020  ORF Transcript_16313/g.42020 Transcript_16313/m.42020 type:complete len:488 (-) Transcript_16313:56-1519(-)
MVLGQSGQDALAPVPETVDVGPGTENRQYQHVLAVAASQELRLTRHAALRKRPGYDLTDPWLAPSNEADAGGGGSSSSAAAHRSVGQWVLGMPCRLMGTGEVVAFLGLDGSGSGTNMCRVRLLDGNIAAHASQYLLPMPTRPARQGDWAYAVDLKGEQAKLNGRRGLCGLTGILAGRSEQRGLWVMFETSDPASPPEMALLADGNLVALPGPPQGAPRTPWEARLAALPGVGGAPLALTDESVQEQRLALLSGPPEQDKDSASDAGSVDLSGSSDSEAGDGDAAESAERNIGGAGSSQRFVPTVGDLVTARTLDRGSAGPASGGGLRHGRVQCVQGHDTGATVTVRLLNEGSLAGEVAEFPAASLVAVSEDELVLNAVCSGCAAAEPEEELLMCEHFGKKCLGCAHLGCLTPELKVVPKGAWLCEPCGGPGSVTSGSCSRKRGRNHAAAEVDLAKAPAKGASIGHAKAKAKAAPKGKQQPKKKAKSA